MDPKFTNPKAVAEAGEKLYADKYRAEFEEKYRGQFVAIDVSTGLAYRGALPEDALRAARQDSPTGIFHLIKIGELGAYRVSYSADAKLDWLFR